MAEIIFAIKYNKMYDIFSLIIKFEIVERHFLWFNGNKEQNSSLAKMSF